jgi:hypothetical protein
MELTFNNTCLNDTDCCNQIVIDSDSFKTYIDNNTLYDIEISIVINCCTDLMF